jgi:hypothetical protein
VPILLALKLVVILRIMYINKKNCQDRPIKGHEGKNLKKLLQVQIVTLAQYIDVPTFTHA